MACQRDSDARHRKVVPSQTSLLAGPFAGAQSALKDDMQDWSGCSARRGALGGVPNLAENLALTRHEALQACGRTEEMNESGVSAVPNIEHISVVENLCAFLNGLRFGARGDHESDSTNEYPRDAASTSRKWQTRLRPDPFAR
jgi:hypothetical protein